MSVSVNGPKTPVTKGSNGIAAATLPNICKMPGPPAPFVPAPLPNIGKSGDSPKGYSKKVKIEGNTVAIKGASFKSMGDMASKGTGGGLVSANTHGPCKFISPGSMDVKFEGKNVHLLSDMMTNNGGPSGSPANAATLMGAVQASGVTYIVREGLCPVCHEEKHDNFEESPGEDGTQADAKKLLDRYEMEEFQRHRPYQKNMIGVVHCKEGHKHAADTRGDRRFFECAKASHHVMVAQTSDKGTISKMKEVTRNPANFKSALGNAQIQFLIRDKGRFPEEKEDFISRNPPGHCAAQKALVWALAHGCTASAMTEKWFSKPQRGGRQAPAETTGPVRHINIGEEFAIVIARPFRDGESVPPCETCNLIIPFLTCQDKEANCLNPDMKGCSKC